MCKVFKISRSAYYAKQHLLPTNRDNENRALLFEIRRIHEKSKASYGSPRIREELKAKGIKVSRQRVARLMKHNNIRAVHRKKFVATTDSKHNYEVVENKLQRDFTTDGPAKVWVSDITYVKTTEGWLYLTVILDLYDRKVVGWSHSKDLTAKNTTVKAWQMAVNNRSVSNKLIFHSDRGVQYACHEFKDLLGSYKTVERSMSRKGNCWDNAVAESIFKSLKVEQVYQNKYKTRQQASLAIFEWIETWYNRNRRHTALQNLTILEFNNLNQMKTAA
jgi:putative transposase